jgi:hypothetical protein
MIRSQNLWGLALVALLALRVGADPPKDAPAAAAPEPAPAPAVDTLKFHMMDGSVITAKMVAKDIVVQTPYGPLKVPVSELRGFTPGLQSHPELQSRIDSLLERLAANDYADRDAAQRELTQLGQPIRGILQGHLKDNDPERRQRVQTILEAIEESADEADTAESPDTPHDPAWVADDAVETRAFTAIGRIAAARFDLQSAYGPLTVNLSDIRSVQRDAAPGREPLRKTIEVAGTNLAPSTLKAAALHLQKGDRVTISASGQITLTNWNNGMAGTPDGITNLQWYERNKIPCCALVGQVGKGGTLFKVGSKYSFKAERAGDLSLGIAWPQNMGDPSITGQFSVKVMVEPHP